MKLSLSYPKKFYYFRTPLLGIPIAYDQFKNLMKAEEYGVASVIPWKDLTRKSFSAGLQFALRNDFR